MISSLRQQFLCPIFFPDASGANELDLNARCRRHPLGILADPFPKWFGELRIIKYPNLPRVQQRRHSPGIADPRQRAEYQYPVVTAQHSGNL
jgi:hypothetical protein